MSRTHPQFSLHAASATTSWNSLRTSVSNWHVSIQPVESELAPSITLFPEVCGHRHEPKWFPGRERMGDEMLFCTKCCCLLLQARKKNTATALFSLQTCGSSRSSFRLHWFICWKKRHKGAKCLRVLGICLVWNMLQDIFLYVVSAYSCKRQYWCTYSCTYKVVHCKMHGRIHF